MSSIRKRIEELTNKKIKEFKADPVLIDPGHIEHGYKPTQHELTNIRIDALIDVLDDMFEESDLCSEKMVARNLNQEGYIAEILCSEQLKVHGSEKVGE